MNLIVRLECGGDMPAIWTEADKALAWSESLSATLR